MTFSNVYLNNIVISITIFLLITSTIITIPIAIVQYRKNGFIAFKRTVVLYLFILFLQTIYILAISPLPDIQAIKNNPRPITDFINLIPFSFIKDIRKEMVELGYTLKNIVKVPAFYQMIFNIIMFIPLGIFLRNYSKKSLKKTAFLGLLLSLFFELTQLSGLYFIYPRPYRTFDVDDLIVNTTGTMVGYMLAPVFMFMFPNEKEEKNKRYEKNKVIKMFPQYLMVNIDLIVALFLNQIIQLIISLFTRIFNFTYNTSIAYNLTLFISFILLFILIPLKKKGYQTVGMSVMKYDIEVENNIKYKVLIRNMLIYLPMMGIFNYRLFIWYHLYFILMIIFRKRQIIFDKLLKIKYVKYYD